MPRCALRIDVVREVHGYSYGWLCEIVRLFSRPTDSIRLNRFSVQNSLIHVHRTSCLYHHRMALQGHLTRRDSCL
jgi:hypothetical protein